MRKIFYTASEIVLSFGIIFALLEGTLRISPSLIPLSLLVNFQKDIREEIAFRRNLENTLNTDPFDRDDNGPPFYLYRPSAVITKPADREDKRSGAVETVKMDELGFCNRSGSYAPETIDIIALGDSFTWCTLVRPEDAWPAELSAISGYSVYNLGLPGASPYEYLQLLKNFGLQKSPRVVIMNIYGGNDLGEAAEFFAYREIGENLNLAQNSSSSAGNAGKEELLRAPCVGLPAYPCGIYRRLKESVGRKSYAFNLAANAGRETVLEAKRILFPAEEKSDADFRYWISPPSQKATGGSPWMNAVAESSEARRAKEDALADSAASCEFFAEGEKARCHGRKAVELHVADRKILLNRGNVDGYQIKFAERFRGGDLRSGVFDRAFQEFVELSRIHSFTPVVSYTPAAYGAYADVITFEDPAIGELMLWYEKEQRRFLEERSAKFQYVFFDVTPHFKIAAERQGKTLLYFPVNVHLTETGHRVLAEALYDFLRDKAILP